VADAVVVNEQDVLLGERLFANVTLEGTIRIQVFLHRIVEGGCSVGFSSGDRGQLVNVTVEAESSVLFDVLHVFSVNVVVVVGLDVVVVVSVFLFLYLRI
jgi:hypothetical protein